MKKILSTLLSLILVLTLSLPVFAQSNTTSQFNTYTNVKLNDEQLRNKTIQHYSYDGLDYVSLRSIFDALGYVVTYDAKAKEVIATKYANSYIFSAETPYYEFNGFGDELIFELEVVNGRQYISYIDISYILNLEISFDKADEVNITQHKSEGFFWKVQKGDTTVYLLGSIHVGTNEMYPVRDEIEKAYYLSDYLVLEVDISEMPSDEVLDEIEKLGVYEEGDSLANHISPELYHELVSFFVDKLGADQEEIDSLKPWVLSQTINSMNLLIFEEYEGELGVDNYYLNNANYSEKPVLALESYMIQYSALSSYSPEAQEAELKIAFEQLKANFEGIENDNFNELEIGTNMLIDLWINGDDAGLEALVKEYKMQDPESYDIMLVKRHDKMIEEIESYLNSGTDDTYFVIAGYLHMLGEDGLIAMLRNKGYEVTRE